MGLVALWHVGSSWTRARTCVPCVGRQTLNHCATREVQLLYFLDFCFRYVWRLGWENCKTRTTDWSASVASQNDLEHGGLRTASLLS